MKKGSLATRWETASPAKMIERIRYVIYHISNILSTGLHSRLKPDNGAIGIHAGFASVSCTIKIRMQMGPNRAKKVCLCCQQTRKGSIPTSRIEVFPETVRSILFAVVKICPMLAKSGRLPRCQRRSDPDWPPAPRRGPAGKVQLTVQGRHEINALGIIILAQRAGDAGCR